MNQIYIQGKEYSKDTDGLSDLVVTVSLNSDKSFSLAIGSELTFKGAAFDILEDYFIPDGQGKILPVDLYISCCNQSLPFEIITDGLEYKCSCKKITAKLRYRNVNQEKYDCLRNRIFWSNSDGSIENTNDFTAFNSPINFAEKNEQGIFNTYFNKKRYIPGTTVVNILNYAVATCGLDSWQSSFMSQSPYDRIAILGPAANKAPKDPQPIYTKDFMANLTFAQVLEVMSPMFNADYRFKDCKIIWEPKKYFESTDSILFNMEEEYSSGRLLTEPCYAFNDDAEENCKIHRFEYVADSLDTQSHEVRDIYNNVVIYDSGNTKKNLKGECSTSVNLHFAEDFDSARLIGFTRHRNGPHPKVLIWDGESKFQGRMDQFATKEYLSFRDSGNNTDNSLYNRFYKECSPDSGNTSTWVIDELKHRPDDFCDIAISLLDNECFAAGISSKQGKFIYESAEIDFSKKMITYKQLKQV